MSLKEILITGFNSFFRWRKAKLVEALVSLRDKYLRLQTRVKELEKEITELKKTHEQEKIKDTNKHVNKPSSKEAEWEKGTPKDEGKKKKGKRKRRKSCEGTGNRPKNMVPKHEETATVDTCDFCGKDSRDQAPLESTNEHIIEDLPDPPEETIVTRVSQEKKYCGDCQEVTTAKPDLALPAADMGLNATVLVCYLWVALCVPYTKIREYLGTFFKVSISTSGLSRHVIRVAGIMKDVHTEILSGLKDSPILHADETGWRVRGSPWWLWVFGTPDAAYFFIDKTRGSAVVRRVLWEIFLWMLVVDGWSASIPVM